MFEKKQEATQQVGLTAEQLQQLMTEVLKVAKQPNAYEQELIDEKRALKERNRAGALEVAKAEMERKAMLKRNCPHHNGKSHTWVAQAHTPAGVKPYFIPTCQRCSTQLAPIQCSTEQVTNGINLHVYKTLDMAMLERMSEQQRVAV